MSTRILFAAALDTGEPDPRQRQFRAVMTGMGALTASAAHSFAVIGMKGFRASRVDLSWLFDEIRDYVLTVPDCDPDRLAPLIKAELPQVVQRLEAFSVSTKDWPEAIGTYNYSISVPTDHSLAS